VREEEGRSGAVVSQNELEQQDDISRAALGHSQTETLARIAVTWPDDGLALMSRGENSRQFQELTEGMRALAIKEISFAASSLPVISDQPEDAVPPQNVFDDLVPTIRRQRADRQFILASHDANIVVAGDLERITALGVAEADIPSGSLHDSRIKAAAIEILEGGRLAFEMRQERYGAR
jgi:hypothetical protein